MKSEITNKFWIMRRQFCTMSSISVAFDNSAYFLETISKGYGLIEEQRIFDGQQYQHFNASPKPITDVLCNLHILENEMSWNKKQY